MTARDAAAAQSHPAGDAIARITDAVIRRVADGGVGALTLGDVARDAGVSKALILYHFDDKDALIAHVIDRLAADITTRERQALTGEASPLALDALWEWLDGELEAGSIRVLVELSHSTSVPVREAASEAAQRRRQTTTQTLARLFDVLGLEPRVPTELLANVVVTFTDGLASTHATGERSARAAYDVFWLALLNLAD